MPRGGDVEAQRGLGEAQVQRSSQLAVDRARRISGVSLLSPRLSELSSIRQTSATQAAAEAEALQRDW